MRMIRKLIVETILIIGLLSALFYFSNVAVQEMKKDTFIDNYQTQIDVLRFIDVDATVLYNQTKIIKLVYEDGILVVKPYGYFGGVDKIKYEANTIYIDNIGPFIYIENNYNNIEEIYFYRLSSEDLQIKSFFIISVFIFALLVAFVLLILTKKYYFEKNILKELCVNSHKNVFNGSFKENIKEIASEVESSSNIVRVYEELLSINEDGIIVCDDELNVLFNNKTTNDFIKRYEDELLISNETLLEVMKKAINEEFVKGTYDYLNNNYFYISSKQVVKNNNYYVIYLTDITEKVKFKNNQINFFNQASHELRSPLTAIQGFIEMMLLCDLEKTASNHALDLSFKECRKVDMLITSIIDISKRFKAEDEYSKINFSKLVEEYIDKNQNRNFSISKLIPANVMLMCNKSKVEVILSNVIKNAFDHNIINGFIDVTIVNDLGLVEITIKNSTACFDNKDIENIFEPFFKGINSIDNKQRTGLGLTLVKSICDAYKYEVNASYEDDIFKVVVSFYSDEIRERFIPKGLK